MPTNALLRKLSIFADLNSEEVELLNETTSDVRATAAKQDIISEGARPDHLHLIVQGWAARYKNLPNGTRQIMAFLIPGDFCDLHGKSSAPWIIPSLRSRHARLRGWRATVSTS